MCFCYNYYIKWSTFSVSFCLILYNLGCIFIRGFLLFTWFFFISIAIYFHHFHYNFNVQRVGYVQAIQTIMQAEWLACFWCISNQDQDTGFSRIYHFKIFSTSDRIIHSLLVIAIFAALLFKLQMWFFLNIRFLIKLLF